MTQSIDEIIETFEFLDEWEDRYRFIVDLGKQLPGLPDDLKTDAAKVQGCQSQVWLIAKPVESDGTRKVEYLADSDALIVRGLVAILLAIYADQEPTSIQSTDSKSVLKKLGLDQHLSPSRANGLFSMDQRIKELATALA